jgi:hypothetical protein
MSLLANTYLVIWSPVPRVSFFILNFILDIQWCRNYYIKVYSKPMYTSTWYLDMIRLVEVVYIGLYMKPLDPFRGWKSDLLIVLTIQAPRALAWWQGLMAPNEEVVGSIPHAGVVLTIIVHPTMMGGPWTLLYGYLKVLWGDTHVRYFQGTSR